MSGTNGHGIDGTPWQARVALFAIGQLALGGAQVAAFLQGGGLWITLGLAGMQLIAAISAAYGPGSAGRLARAVGNAIATGRNDKDKESLPPPTP